MPFISSMHQISAPYLLGADTNLPPGSIGGGLNFIRLAIISSQVNVTKLEQMAVAASNAGKIDPISNINGSKVYIFSGQLDLFAPPCKITVTGF